MSLSRPNQESGLRYLTNRGNLLDALSSGCIRPGVAMQKWYPDLSSDAPEFLVLLRQDPSPALTEKAGGDQAGQFPVLIDLRSTSGSFIVPAGKVGADDNDAMASGAFFASGTIPSGQIARVVFRSSEHLDEFTARQYDNIRTNLQRMRFVVDPSRFSGSLGAVPDAAGNAAPGVIDRSRYDNSSRTGSLIILLGKLFELAGDLDFGYFAETLNRLRGRITEQDKETLEVSDVRELAQGVVISYLNQVVERPLDQEERITLDLILEVLTGIEPHAFSARSLLQSVIDVATANEVSTEGLDSIRDAIDGLADADEIGPSLNRIETSFLTFLRRPEPQRLTTWLLEPVRPDSTTLLVATVFSGLSSRRELLPVEARPANENLERIIDTWMAAWVSGSYIDLGRIEALKLPIGTASDGADETVAAGDTLLLSRRLDQQAEVTIEASREPVETAIADLSGTADIASGQTPADPAEGSTADAIDTLLASDLTDPVHVEAALVLCERRPWSDLVQTRIRLGGIPFSLDGGRKSSELSLTIDRFVPASDLEFVFDVPAFRTAIETDRAKITKVMEKRISDILQGPVAAKNRAAARGRRGNQKPKQIGLTD